MKKTTCTLFSLAILFVITLGSGFFGFHQAQATGKLAKVKNVSVVTKDTTSITLRWNKVKKATTYQVKVMDKNKQKIRQVKSKKLTKQITQLTKNTVYHFQVRAQRKKSFGAWSKFKKVKTANVNEDDGDNDNEDDGDGDDDNGDGDDGSGDSSLPVVDLSAAAYSGTEEGGAITITVNLSAAASSAVTVDYATSDGTATAGTDYTAASGTLTFAANDTSETFTVTPISDTDNEDDETITITLSNASGATVASTNNPAVITITDNDTLTLSTSAFTDGGTIPIAYTCDASADPDDYGVSPDLSWISLPSGTQSFFLYVRDLDSSPADFVHWAVKNISSSTTSVAQDAVPAGGTELFNDFGLTGWAGPCPPAADPSHTYQFTVYALSTASLTSSTVSEALTEMNASILEQASITGEYEL